MPQQGSVLLLGIEQKSTLFQGCWELPPAIQTSSTEELKSIIQESLSKKHEVHTCWQMLHNFFIQQTMFSLAKVSIKFSSTDFHCFLNWLNIPLSFTEYLVKSLFMTLLYKKKKKKRWKFFKMHHRTSVTFNYTYNLQIAMIGLTVSL